jgi:hypothetical protein
MKYIDNQSELFVSIIAFNSEQELIPNSPLTSLDTSPGLTISLSSTFLLRHLVVFQRFTSSLVVMSNKLQL